MKRKLIIFCLLLGCAIAYADEVTISTATLNPGGSQVLVTVSLSGTRAYTSYNMDIILPEGWSIPFSGDNPLVGMKKPGLYPFTEDPFSGDKSYFHTLSCTYGVVGERVLRLACISTSNKSFTANSGDLFMMYLQASPLAKPGTPDISIINTDFGTYDSGTGKVTPYHFDDAVSNAVTVSTSATATLSVSSALWSTCVLPFDAAIPSGVEAYTCQQIENDAVYMSPVTSFEAYTPYVLHSNASYSGDLSGTVDVANYPDAGYVDDAVGILHGAIVGQTVSTGYVLQKDPDEAEPKFYDMNGVDFSIPAGKCWMTVPVGNNAPSIRLIIGSPTDIKAGPEQLNSQIYNVLGMPVSRPLSGQLYIQNGQIFYQK